MRSRGAVRSRRRRRRRSKSSGAPQGEIISASFLYYSFCLSQLNCSDNPAVINNGQLFLASFFFYTSRSSTSKRRTWNIYGKEEQQSEKSNWLLYVIINGFLFLLSPCFCVKTIVCLFCYAGPQNVFFSRFFGTWRSELQNVTLLFIDTLLSATWEYAFINPGLQVFISSIAMLLAEQFFL